MSVGTINHNINSLNSLRSLQKNDRDMNKSLERLSSGLRINRAADDPAGLAVSEKMRGQISGMKRASSNIQDAISMVQTAEGALDTVHSSIQRIRELAIKAANDSYTISDRKKIQSEVDNLIFEIDNMSEYTEFNTKKLLNGDLLGKANTDSSVAKANVLSTVKDADYSVNILFAGKSCNVNGKKLDDINNDGKIDINDIGLTEKSHIELYCGEHVETIFLDKNDTLSDIVFKINRSSAGIKAGLSSSENSISLSSIRKGEKYNITFGDDPDGVAERLGLLDINATSSGIGAMIEVCVSDGIDKGARLGVFSSSSRTFGETEFAHPVVAGNNTKSTDYLKGFEITLDDSSNISNFSSNYNVLFSSNRDGNNEIYSMNKDGSMQTRITNNPSSDTAPSYSYDGSKIVFQSDRDGNNEIYVMDSDGYNQKRLTNNGSDDINPIFSPDGSKILFTSTRDGNAEFYIMDSDGSNQTRLTNNTDTDLAASFSPDGSKIAFSSRRGGNWDIYTMDIDGSNEKRITTNASVDWTPRFTPDGTKMAFVSNRSGGLEVYYMDLDGSNQTLTTNAGGAKWIPAFSPDGSQIFYSSDSDGDWDVYSMNLDGTNQKNIINNAVFDDATGLVGSGLSLAPSGGSFRLQVRDTRPVFQISANSEQTMRTIFPNISSMGLGLMDGYYANGTFYNGINTKNDGSVSKDYRLTLSVQTQSAAENAITKLDKALEIISSARSSLGSFQNSLSKAFDYSNIANENLTSSESRIRDADLAEQMSVFTKEQIISQSATAMLAQSNSKAQNILQLLK